MQANFALHEVNGLTLSDNISRMIPAEAATLGHRTRKERGLQTHGLLIGSSSDHAMRALSDELHQFNNWLLVC